ncbi:uncharacterized protein LOC111674008 [Orussus abietinus]|uniref:uncharacterized protein LOC111674008 n=1 Tax=Orussus abietinus TaxID=222816 RepID=UPI000C715DEF|nr:uncharacterized protein LOC111674008 [Orussus abietinus]
MNGSRSHTPDVLSPEATGSPATGSQRGQGQGGASPTMQQRIKAIGVPTPLAISSPIRRVKPGHRPIWNSAFFKGAMCAKAHHRIPLLGCLSISSRPRRQALLAALYGMIELMGSAAQHDTDEEKSTPESTGQENRLNKL